MPGNQEQVSSLEVLVERARDLCLMSRRSVLGIAGPPASGKSLLAETLVAAVGPRAVLLPMDGFHLANAELARLGRCERKGAPDTFDAAGYVDLLARVRRETSRTVYAPRFHREVEESYAGEIPVEPGVRLVVTEGNYLLYDDGDWSDVRGLLDQAWFLDLPDPIRQDRLIARHRAYGRSLEQARERTLGSDERNADVVRGGRGRATVRVDMAGIELMPQAPADRG